METKHLLMAAGALGLGYVVWRSLGASKSSTTSTSAASPASSPSACSSLPMATASTDFDGMPADYRAVYEAPLKLNKSDVNSMSQESAAMGAENLASQARCAGYTAAADKLTAKAAEIRSWTP